MVKSVGREGPSLRQPPTVRMKTRMAMRVRMARRRSQGVKMRRWRTGKGLDKRMTKMVKDLVLEAVAGRRLGSMQQ